jgi:methionyl-tRNA synthetase
MTRRQRPRRLVTAALPYANGPIHIGHLVEYLQADFWVRWNKMNARDCVYICADDTHGTPIMVKARELGLTPEAWIAKSHAEHARDFADFGVGFDIYSSTNSQENRELSEKFYAALRDQGHLRTRTQEQLWCDHDRMFLPDRFVKGVCPKCGATEQYGDSCDKCGSTYSASELKSPACAICGSKPNLKPTSVISVKLSDFRDFLREWVPAHSPVEAANKLSEWVEGELLDWDISRDAPYFGFEIPDHPGKFFYVWLTAPIGYVSSTRQLCDQRGLNFEDYWSRGDDEIYHFIGKDIIKFHCLFWPAMLKTAGFKTPTQVFVHGMLTVNGEKMSKSKGTSITARTYLNHLDPQFLRYYYATKLTSGMSDLDLGLDDFVNRVNSELVGKITNLGSRGAQMLAKRLDGRLSRLDHDGRALLERAQARRATIAAAYEARDFARAIQEVREIADEANKYFDEKAPWNLIKSDPEATRAVLSTTLNVFRLLAIALKPILPKYADQVARLLGEASYKWRDGEAVLEGGQVGEYEHLATRVDAEKVQAMVDASKPAGTPLNSNPPPTKSPPAQSSATTAQSSAAPNVIDIDTFGKIDLRIAKIIAAEAVPEADKLIKLRVDLGPLGERQIFAGIKSAYDPAQLVGRLTVVVANLAPRKMKFGMSEGMVLAASDPNESGGTKPMFLLSPDSGAKPGDRVK